MNMQSPCLHGTNIFDGATVSATLARCGGAFARCGDAWWRDSREGSAGGDSRGAPRGQEAITSLRMCICMCVLAGGEEGG